MIKALIMAALLVAVDSRVTDNVSQDKIVQAQEHLAIMEENCVKGGIAIGIKLALRNPECYTNFDETIEQGWKIWQSY